MSTTNLRRDDLDLAKGLGIFLVVLGHLVAKAPPAGNAWYTILQTAIYTFHMPFFVFLSGYVAFMTGAGQTPPARWGKLVRRRAERLLLPFFLFGGLLLVGKMVAARFVYVDNLPQTSWEAVVNLVWNTDHSPAISIWYMFIIFLSAVLTPLLIWLARGGRWLALAVALALFYWGLPHRLFLDRFAEYYVFFVFGALASDAGDDWLMLIDRLYLLLLAMLLAALFVMFQQDSFDPHWSHLLCGVLAIPALHGLVRRTTLSGSRTLAFLGTYSFVIYLLNTPAIGLAKGVLMRWVPWDGAGFPVHAAIGLLVGLLLPVAIKVLLFRRWPYLDRLTD